MNSRFFNFVFWIFAACIFAASQSAQAQTVDPSVKVTGPDNLETGIAGTYKAKFSKGSDTTLVVQSYEWTVPWCGSGVFGLSGIKGRINGDTLNNPVTIASTVDSLSIPIIYGDFFNDTRDDELTVKVTYKNSSNDEGFAYGKKTIKIKRVWVPYFEGSAQIPECCLAPFTMKAINYADANNFTWSVTPPTQAAITGGQGTNTVTITPITYTGSFTLNCTARRSSGLTSYTRSNSIVITRANPATHSIQDSQNYFCKGQNYQLCIDTICGQTGTNWSIPSTLQIVSGQGTPCITITPKSSTPDGTSVSIYATAVLAGGCNVSASPTKTYKVFSSGTPPMPQGYITLDLEEGSDPCNDPIYIVNWHPTVPFVNGYTSVSPGIVLGGNHPIGGGGGTTAPKVKIKVCNVNQCSNLKSCKDFYVDRPLPCNEDPIAPGGGGEKSGGLGSKKAVGPNSLPFPENIEIYPNPSTGRFYLSQPLGKTNGTLALFDASGIPLYDTPLDMLSGGVGFPQTALPKGSYFVQLRLESETFTKKIIVQ